MLEGWIDYGARWPQAIQENLDKCAAFVKVGDTTPVERNPQGASPYGALDMAGNVWEWTLSLLVHAR